MRSHATVLLATICLVLASCGKQRPPMKFLLPAEQHGWFRLCYDVKDQPPLVTRDGRLIVDFSSGSVVSTSSHLIEGWADDEWYSIGKNRELQQIVTWPGKANIMVRDVVIRMRGEERCEEFFVGSETARAEQPSPWQD